MSDPDQDMGSRDGTPDSVLGITTPDDGPRPGPSTPAPKKKKKQEKVPVGLKPPYRPRPSIPPFLTEDRTKTGGFYFENMAAMQEKTDFTLWRVDFEDRTIPYTDEQHREVVKQIVDAFMDMDNANDTKDNAYRKRLTPGTNVYYMDWTIEARAWDIVRIVKSIHREGFTVSIYDRNIVGSIMQTMRWTFQDRIDWICVVLKTSKNVATCLMKNEKIWTIVGAPHKLYNSTIVNTVSNANRNVWIKNGRKADADHQKRQVKRQKTNNDAGNTFLSPAAIDMDTAINPGAEASAAVPDPDTSRANARIHRAPGPRLESRKSKYTVGSPVAVPRPANHDSSTVPSLSHVDYGNTAFSNYPGTSSLAPAPPPPWRPSSAPLSSRQTNDADVAALHDGLVDGKSIGALMDGMTGAVVAAADDAKVIPSIEDVNMGNSDEIAVTKKTAVDDEAKTETDTNSKKHAAIEDRRIRLPASQLGSYTATNHVNYQDDSAPSLEKAQAFLKNHKGTINWHHKRPPKPLPLTSANPFIESDSELSDAPSDLSELHVAVRKTNCPMSNTKVDSLEPRVYDAADIDAAKLLAGLSSFR